MKALDTSATYEIEIENDLPSWSIFKNVHVSSASLGGDLTLNIWSLTPERKLYKSLYYSVFGEYYCSGSENYDKEEESIPDIDKETRAIIRKYLTFEYVDKILDGSMICSSYIFDIFYGEDTDNENNENNDNKDTDNENHETDDETDKKIFDEL